MTRNANTDTYCMQAECRICNDLGLMIGICSRHWLQRLLFELSNNQRELYDQVSCQIDQAIIP